VIGITIGVGRWRETAELAAAAVRRHAALEVVDLDDAVWEKLRGDYSYPGFLKLHVFDLVGADDVLIFDADAIHINPWTPQRYARRRGVVGVPDRYIGELSYEAGLPPDQYINAGMMILNRQHHEPMLSLARELHARGERPRHREQALINKARRLLGIPLVQLDERYNHLLFLDDPEFDPKRTVIAHWTCQEHELAAIEAFCAADEIVCEKNAAEAAGRYIDTIPPYPSAFKGRGIVTCAGGTKYNTCAWVLINRLRDLGCRLPIEVWYLGEKERDDSWMDLVRPLGVTFIDAAQVARSRTGRASGTPGHPKLGGWESKPFAMLHTRFREVLFLDADNLPMVDPTFLFDSPEYRATGAIFWPEMNRIPPGHVHWRAFGVQYRDEPDQESGQVLVDKERCWRALNLCNWYNERSYYFYRIAVGDKDTFRYAWHRLGQRFAMPEAAALLPGAFCQCDFDGRLIFQHRFRPKWSLGHNPSIPGFIDEERCLSYIDDLRRQWRPLDGVIPALPAPSREQMAKTAGVATFERVGRASWPIELLPSGLVGEGGNERLFCWWLADGELFFASSEGALGYRLTRQRDGSWVGPSPDHPREVVRLTTASP
jgi:hypothetical protein